MQTKYVAPRKIAIRLAQSGLNKPPQQWSRLFFQLVGVELTTALIVFGALAIVQREQTQAECLNDAISDLTVQKRYCLASQTEHLAAITSDPRPALQLATRIDKNATACGQQAKLAKRIAAVLPRQKPVPPGTSLTIRKITNYPPVTFIDVAVRDESGRPIHGLTRADFELTNGSRRLRQVAVAEDYTVESTLAVAVLLDCSNSMEGSFLEAAKNVASGFSKSMARQSRIRIWKFADNVNALTPWTTDEELLNDAIRPLTIGGGTALYRAIHDAAGSLATRPEPKSIVVLTDGEDTEKKINPEALVAECLKTHITVHAIGLGQPKDGFALLKQLTEQTGGSFKLSSTEHDLANSFAATSRNLREPIYRLAVSEPAHKAEFLTLTVAGTAQTVMLGQFE